MYVSAVLFILLVVMIGYKCNILYNEQTPEIILCTRPVLVLFSFWTGGGRAM